ncbi:MAG TPA: hypothetical protein VGC85_02130, partial [Chthoniobacterales bacterium]
MKKSLIHHAGQPGRHDTKHSFLRKAACLAGALCLLSLGNALAAPPPPAQDILANARLRVSQQDFAVDGQLRENGRVSPFRLTQQGPVIRYSFTNPDEALQL